MTTDRKILLMLALRWRRARAYKTKVLNELGMTDNKIQAMTEERCAWNALQAAYAVYDLNLDENTFDDLKSKSVFDR